MITEAGEFYYPTTRDQRFYRVDGKLKAEIDVCFTHENVEGDPYPPSIVECRYAVLQISNKGGRGYVTYDRLLCRIVNGVYYGSIQSALESAQMYNEYPESPQDMAPNGVALGLHYPRYRKNKVE